jgi:lipopolysaccharide transport system ATP-binding protein
MYKLFSSRTDNFVDALALARVLPWRTVSYREFWALRGIDLELGRGSRIGIIGRNGAGKSTLLKLITGNLEPTEGSVEVFGEVQALLDAGAGFHPDFTGRENVRAALTYQGRSPREIEAALAEIADFTELEEFLDQPFRTYSAGMQARLTFATATSIRPEIVIVDEILGAGDAYFISKSTERMRALVEGGASILLVSHALSQITQMCETAIWLERGQIVAAGEALEIVKSYEQFIRQLDDRRLQAKNAKRRAGVSSSLALDLPAATLVVRLVLRGDERGRLDLAEARLGEDGREGDRVAVGAPQDVDRGHAAFVLLEGSQWSGPVDSSAGFHRSLTHDGPPAETAGMVGFDVLALSQGSELALELVYRAPDGAGAEVQLIQGAETVSLGSLEPARDWTTARYALRVGHDVVLPQAAAQANGARPQAELSHWPGEGSLRILEADVVDALGAARAVFEVGSALRFRLSFAAARSGSYRVLPAAVIYRIDGLNITSQLGDWLTLQLEADEPKRLSVTLDPLNLGNGNYVVSLALYKSFDPHLGDPPVVYDWIDRSLEFQVVGTPPAITSVFEHPSSWTLE